MVMLHLLKNAEANGALQGAGVARKLSPEQVQELAMQAEKVERERVRLALLLQEYGLNPNGVYHITPEGMAVPA